MRPRARIGAALAIGIAIAVAVTHRTRAPQPAPGARALAPFATPPGITLQTRHTGEAPRRGVVPDVIYADALGHSLYTYDPDGPAGKATCSGECASAWPPALAAPDAVAMGDWTLLRRDDGSRQWALHGAPLYVSAAQATDSDTRGDARGDGAAGGAWHVAVFHPGTGVVLPARIEVRVISNGGGAGLTDGTGMTLYEFDGDAGLAANYCSQHPDCARHWLPFEAPAIANPRGDFAPQARDDGITQWTYRGRALYRFDEDREAGDVRGVGADPHFGVAWILRQWMPADATIRHDAALGDIVALTNGITLYQRDRPATGEGHSFRENHGTAALGRWFGTATCRGDCLKDWQPYLAPEGAVPCGYWEIAQRDDGPRQWTYKGFALYTYAADQPGEVGGNNRFELARLGDAEDGYVPPGGVTPGLGLTALAWHAVIP